ncbi:MAG: hypothetical protein ACNA8P_12680, partial [Phycisphaerales bacterium]
MVRLLRSRIMTACCAGSLFLLAPLNFGPIALADSKDEKSKVRSVDEHLTLERIFPERSAFGPSASAMSFSHDGRYAAYLYRPNIERRHGNDIWLYDTQTGETERLTSVSVLSPFQASTRKVAEDRLEQAKKARRIPPQKVEADDTD